MDVQKITLNINNSKETVQTLHIVGGEHGNGMQGRAVHVHAQPNVTYQLIDDSTQLGPQNIAVKRDGQNLLISFKGGDLSHPDLIIDDYYKPNGELGYNSGSNNLLLGQAANGHFYSYIPESGQQHDAVSILANEVSAGQVLGGADHSTAPWWQAAVASTVATPTIPSQPGATPLIPINTEPTHHTANPVVVAEHQPDVPSPVDDEVIADPASSTLFSAMVAAATATSIYVAHIGEPDSSDNGQTSTTPTQQSPTPQEPYTLDAQTGTIDVHNSDTLDLSKFHNISHINFDNASATQNLTISAQDVKNITPDSDHTLYISTNDTHDTVSLSGLVGNFAGDKEVNGVHYHAYTDPTDPSVHLFVQDSLTQSFDKATGILSVHDFGNLTYPQLHDVTNIHLDNDTLDQSLPISTHDIMQITPNNDHTLYITSSDVSHDKVILDHGLTADTNADKDLNGVHFHAYTDSDQPGVHLFIQDGLNVDQNDQIFDGHTQTVYTDGTSNWGDNSGVLAQNTHFVVLNDSHTAQHLSIPQHDIEWATPEDDHSLYFSSTDPNDTVNPAVGEFVAAPSDDKTINGVHYSAYVGHDHQDYHLYIQTSLIH